MGVTDHEFYNRADIMKAKQTISLTVRNTQELSVSAQELLPQQLLAAAVAQQTWSPWLLTQL